MNPSFYSPDYSTARQRFRDAASQAGWRLEAFPIDTLGPNGEELTVDVACSPWGDPNKALVVSSGLHGVEAFLGSAVQLALLAGEARNSPESPAHIFIHSLNPYGFAWLRRCDENNVDPNRNFLLPDEAYTGSPDGYAELDALLNPQRPPSRWEPFRLKAMWAIARHGMAKLQQAIAAGQYAYPRGLFFGGAAPSRCLELLRDHLPRWLQGAHDVVHLDFHTGLGASGVGRLLIEYALDAEQRQRLLEWFGTDSFEACDASTVAYHTRGGLGQWCVSRKLAAKYLYACAEFGTYGPVRVLGGLRAENQAHHWGSPSSPSTQRAKQDLKELFCPASPAWRERVLEQGLAFVKQAARGLTTAP
jgi:hypothetical protein